MSTLNDYKDYLADCAMAAEQDFNQELDTDENKDYRRGFKAGTLMTLLAMRAYLGSVLNAANQQSTD